MGRIPIEHSILDMASHHAAHIPTACSLVAGFRLHFTKPPLKRYLGSALFVDSTANISKLILELGMFGTASWAAWKMRRYVYFLMIPHSAIYIVCSYHL
jgi:hypothetical protein